MSTNRRGLFIVVEGLDRSGKSTQSSSLVSRLESMGVPVKLMKFPDRTTPIGRMIDAYLRSESDVDDHAIHLLFSANRWELASTIESLLIEGTTIICDRYAFSGVAFSASKLIPSDPNVPLLPFEWCRAPDIGLPAPDLTLFLDVCPDVAKQRGGYGEERYEKEEMQRRVREVFLRIAEEANASRTLPESDTNMKWVKIDASVDLEIVTQKIWNEIEPLLTTDQKPLRRLWARHLSS